MTRLDADRPPASPDAQWRAEYSRRQHEARIEAVQPDLFGAPDIEHFRPNTATKPAFVMKRRYKARPDLSADERASMLASAANWLRVGQRVRLDPDSPNRFAGREGVIWRICSPVFAELTYINFDLIGNERSEKIAQVELRDVGPIEG